MKIKKKTKKSRLFIKITASVLLVSAFGIGTYAAFIKIKSTFPVRRVIFIGNKHLSADELRSISGIRRNASLLTLSTRQVSEKLLGSPWIKSVGVRKEFPDTLSVTVSEVVPFALLDANGRLFIINEKGDILEELKGNTIPFLPIITGNPAQERECFSEALILAKAMIDMGMSSERDQIEIVLSKPHELTSIIDGMTVKIGVGEYREKLERLVELEEDIQRRKIMVDYIDLRFANRVVVKPIKEVIR